MSKDSESISLNELTAGLLQSVAEADVAMQLHQLRIWKQAAELDPLLGNLCQVGKGGIGKPQEKDHVWRDLLEGLDRLNNLAIGQVSLSFVLEEVRPWWWKRLWYWISGQKPPRRFRLAPSTGRPKGFRLQMKIAVSRRPDGSWKISPDTEHIPPELVNAALPNLFG